MRILIASILMFCVILVIFWHFDIGFNVTPSLPKGLYMTVDESPIRGDIVKFCLENEEFIKIAKENEYVANGICESGLRPLLKIVAGMAGDTICMKENGIYVTKKTRDIACVWSLPKKEDSKGRAIHSRLKNGVISENQLILFTTHKGSFDSRYFGLIDIHTVSKVTNLLTF